jgi:hypothetical protein
VKRLIGLLLLPLGLAACGEETPTGVGAGLLPGDAIRTFEVVLQPQQYLVWDTTFGQYTAPQDADFLVVARDFEGALNSHGLIRFHVPQVLLLTDAGGVLRQDSAPQYIGGTLRIVVDSALSTAEPVRLALHRTTQAWHPSATWQYAVDTLGTRVAWAQPGAVGGARVDTATWTAAGSDTLVFDLDEATARAWADTLNAARGGLLVLETPGGRVITGTPSLEMQARSNFRPDTTYVVQAGLAGKTFIFAPELPAIAADLRVGGTPAWRSILRFQERLDTITVPCPGVPGCRIRLADATINHAALQLQPRQPPPGMRPETDLNVGVYVVLPAAQIPLQRSPLGDVISGTPVPADRFAAPATPLVEVGVTEFLQAVSTPPVEGVTFVPRYLGLVQLQQRTFGFGSFEPMPSLRLVLSIARELQLP